MRMWQSALLQKKSAGQWEVAREGGGGGWRGEGVDPSPPSGWQMISEQVTDLFDK